MNAIFDANAPTRFPPHPDFRLHAVSAVFLVLSCFSPAILSASSAPRSSNSSHRSNASSPPKKGTAPFDERARYAWRKRLLELDRAVARGRAADAIPGLLELEKTHVEADLYRVLARAYRQAGDRSHAADALTRYLTLEPADASAWEELGALRQSEQNSAEAKAAYDKALKLDPSLTRARNGRAVILFNAGDYPAAYTEFSQLLKAGVVNVSTLEGAGYSAYEMERWDVAESCFRQLLPMRPNRPTLRAALAECLYRRDDFEEMASFLESSRERFPTDSAIVSLLANAYIGLSRYDAAIDTFRYLDLMRGLSVTERLSLGDLMAYRGLPGAAADEYERALADAGRKNVSVSTDDRIKYADMLSACGRARDAVAVYESLLADAKTDIKVWMGLGYLYREIGDTDKAYLAFKTVVKYEPGAGTAWLEIGDIALNAGRLDDAADAYAAAAQIQATAADGDAGLGDIAYQTGDLESALTHYRAALNLRPDDDRFALIIRRIEAEQAE